MKENTRNGYGFSLDAKQFARDRAGLGLVTGKLAGGKCEFPGEKCFEKPEPFVAHLTSCFEARLDNKDKRAVSDVLENGLVQCRKHNAFHDVQERFQIESLLAERYKKKGHTLYERRHN